MALLSVSRPLVCGWLARSPAPRKLALLDTYVVKGGDVHIGVALALGLPVEEAEANFEAGRTLSFPGLG